MNQIVINDKLFKLFISSETIQNRVTELAKELTVDLKDKNPLFLGILNGSFMFSSDLFKQLHIYARITFLKLASYQGDKSAGYVKQLIGINEAITGQHIVILEDIVDTGITLDHITRMLAGYQPASVRVVSLLLKPYALKKDIKIDYTGFKIPDVFVIGYGLDYMGYGRNSGDIYKLSE